MADSVRPPSGPGPAAQLDAALGVELGAVLSGKYRVDRVLGTGGMGVVVAATQLALDRTVAIKFVRADSVQDPLAVERLLREAKAVASISSEHVARVLDVGTLEPGTAGALGAGVPFIVMEYLDGSDLQTLLQSSGPLSAMDAVDFLMQACEALAEAHRNGIVHRDIKPANVFVARLPGGAACVKVVDFGISKMIGLGSLEPLTLPTSVVGSLYHMAPEQMRGAPVDARTDVWALGLLFFEMLTGRKPFRDEAWPAVCARILADGAPFLGAPIDGIDSELSAVIERCLRRAPAERYGNVAELAVALAPFGSRNARSSLERIVRLATSTGSLSAASLEGAVPRSHQTPSNLAAALDSTRPVSARGPGTQPQTHGLSWPGRLSTPAPLAAPPSAPTASFARPWQLAVGAGAVAIGAAFFLLGREPMAPAAPRPQPQPLESISRDVGPAAGATPAAQGVPLPAPPPSPAAAPQPVVAGASGAARVGAGGAPGSAMPPAGSAAAGAASSSSPSSPRLATGGRGALRASPQPVAPAPVEPSAAANAPAAPLEPAPDAPRRLPKPPPKTPDPWDLSDIDFQDGRRP